MWRILIYDGANVPKKVAEVSDDLCFGIGGFGVDADGCGDAK